MEVRHNAVSAVAVTRCGTYSPAEVDAAVNRQFTLLGGIEKFVGSGDSVLIKPNFIVPKPARFAAQTDPAVILAVVRAVKDAGGKPFVGDSPAWSNVQACVRSLGLDEPLRKMSVPVRALDRPVVIKAGPVRVGISRLAIEADRIINLPKLKAHQQLGATFAIKNMFGCVSGKQKAFLHFTKGNSYDDFCRMLIGIYEYLHPVLSIIDSVAGMEGMGPINGRPRHIGCLIGGVDPMACEIICCEIVNFRPEQMPIIVTAEKIGFGCADRSRILILGDGCADFICRDFAPAQQRPLRFSFGQVCRSVSKQLLLLLGNAFGAYRSK